MADPPIKVDNLPMDKLRQKPPGRVLLPERPATFAEFGLDLKPYFTLYKDQDRPATFAHFGVDVERERPVVDTVVGPVSPLTLLVQILLIICFPNP